jgi:parvulin-like peptidyl-prolyl isomerase
VFLPSRAFTLQPAPGARALAMLAVVAACAACHDKAPPAGDGQPHHTIDGLTAEQSAHVLAKVGSSTITLGDFAAALEHMDQFDRIRYQSVEKRKELLNEMINAKLLADEAREKGYDKDPKTQEDLRAVLRDAMLKEARRGAPTPAEIPADEVHAYYDAHRDEFRDPERRRVSVVVLDSRAAAQAVLDQAKKTPTPAAWGALVKTRSTDPAARANVPVDLAGDLGLVTPPADPSAAKPDLRGDNPRVPDAVRAAAFALANVGDVAPDVVAVGNKFYVVRLTGKNAAQDRTFQEAERSIRVKMSQDKLRGREDALLADLRTKFPVQIDDATMATVSVDVPDGGFAGADGGDAATGLP